MSDQEVDGHEAVSRENNVSLMSDQAVPELIYDNIESDEEVNNIDVPVLPVIIDSPETKARRRERKLVWTVLFKSLVKKLIWPC